MIVYWGLLKKEITITKKLVYFHKAQFNDVQLAEASTLQTIKRFHEKEGNHKLVLSTWDEITDSWLHQSGARTILTDVIFHFR